MKKIILSSTLVLGFVAASTLAVNADTKPVETTLSLKGVDPAEGLKITKADNLTFGEGKIGADTLYLATSNGAVKTPQLEVTDITGSAAGWNVSAELSEFKKENAETITLKGVELFFPKAPKLTTSNEVITDETTPTSLGGQNLAPSDKPEHKDGVIVKPGPDGKATILNANPTQGSGRWNVEYSAAAGNRAVAIKIPAGNQTGNYKATLTYTLASGPKAQ